MPPLIWAILLLLLALVLVGLEIFLPVMGALGSMAVVAVIAATFMAYQWNGWYGAMGILAVAGVLVPAVMAYCTYLWPYTPFAQWLMLNPPLPTEIPATIEKLKALIGQTGHAKSMMLPSGTIRIAGHNYDALAEGDAIEPEAPIVVVAVKMGRLIVRADDSPPAESTRRPQHADDVLNQPIDKLGLDEFESPLS